MVVRLYPGYTIYRRTKPLSIASYSYQAIEAEYLVLIGLLYMPENSFFFKIKLSMYIYIYFKAIFFILISKINTQLIIGFIKLVEIEYKKNISQMYKRFVYYMHTHNLYTYISTITHLAGPLQSFLLTLFLSVFLSATAATAATAAARSRFLIQHIQ
jgi:hypothetical protein